MLGLKGIGGSDAHGLLTVGQAYTHFLKFRAPDLPEIRSSAMSEPYNVV
ncbi:hypothetical protein ES708_12523 [subsurface metagenome]